MFPLPEDGLRGKIPSSRTRLLCRIAPFDMVWAGVTPVLAFLVRDGAISRLDMVAAYTAVAFIAALITFQWFRTSSPIATYFSVHDAFSVIKACLTTAALTAVFLFIFTRLEDAPRSIPLIHFLILTSGLIGVRVIARLAHTRREVVTRYGSTELENVLIIGATRLAWFFSKMVEEFAAHERRIVAIVDERASLVGRSLNGYSIVGAPADLSRIIDEYETHGVVIGQIVVAAHPDDLAPATWAMVQDICKARSLAIEWLHEQYSLPSAEVTERFASSSAPVFEGVIRGWSYWKTKRILDVIAAALMLVILAPLSALVSALVFVDVGFPIVFWQQRVGYLGRTLHVYKFRTMRNSFDRQKRPTPESERISFLGWLLRRNRLDEIPQLFNILMGSMSLIGPRPLLPIDQPKNIRIRLQVRPGLSGLAQINGGTLLSPEEKDALDEWYVHNASLGLDFKIILKTVWVVLRGERRNESAISEAVTYRNARLDLSIDDLRGPQGAHS